MKKISRKTYLVIIMSKTAKLANEVMEFGITS